METWTKVLVYGTFDGFTFSTDEPTRINVVLDGGEIVEVPEDFVVSADQMVNKYKIRLKDVIERIEKFDLGTNFITTFTQLEENTPVKKLKKLVLAGCLIVRGLRSRR